MPAHPDGGGLYQSGLMTINVFVPSTNQSSVETAFCADFLLVVVNSPQDRCLGCLYDG